MRSDGKETELPGGSMALGLLNFVYAVSLSLDLCVVILKIRKTLLLMVLDVKATCSGSTHGLIKNFYIY